MSSPSDSPNSTVITRLQSLTQRQMQVCKLVVEGMTNKEIAAQLGITVHTVKVHRAEVMRQMAVDSVAELVRAVLAPHATPGEPPAAPSVMDLARPLRVIIVEDQDLMRQLMTRSLNQYGHHAVGVRNGTELQDEWSRGQADVLVLDVELGTQETGHDIAERFRQDSGCGVIMVSARGRVDDRVEGLEHGADVYMVKPVSFRELHSAVSNLGKRIRGG